MSAGSMRVLWLLAAAAALAVAGTTTADVTTTAGATTTVEGTTVTGSTGVPSTAAGVTTTIGGATTTVSGSSTTVVPSTTVVTTIDPCIVPTTAAQSTTQAGTTAAGQTTTGGAATTSAGAATTSAGAATTSAGAATTSAGAATTTAGAGSATAGATTTVAATTTVPKLMEENNPTITAAETTVGVTTTSIGDSTTAGGSTTTGATTTSIGDSTTTGGSTTTGAATTVGASTTAGFTTTSAVPVTTNCVTTTTMATTTITPLYSNKDFVVSCADARCKYTLNAPAQDAAFLSEEEKRLDTANNTLFGISSDVSGLNDTYSLDAENVTAQIADWQAKLDDINDLLVAANLSIANLSSLLDTAAHDASDAQAFVLILKLRQRDSCLYQSCLAPTTPSTTTTTTPVPTTTLDQCRRASGAYKCEHEGNCTINSVSGQPYCECPGDLDGQKHCSTGRCGLASDPTISGAGPLWSPGVNSSSPGNDTTSYASADCVWTMLPSNDGDIFQVVDFKNDYHVSICGDNELWISNTFNNKVKLTSTTTSRQLSFVLNKGGPITLSLLASGDAPPPTGCYFALQMTEVAKPTKAPAEQRESAWKWWPW